MRLSRRGFDKERYLKKAVRLRRALSEMLCRLITRFILTPSCRSPH
jgi:hypothetical protein